MTDADRLTSALWAVFADEIASGDPVRFCFTHETLKELFVRLGIDGPAPLDLVSNAARQCFDVEGDYAVLRQGALAPTALGHSHAIVLVCQQVLAVEEMVRDRSGYSENAYFPRLRAVMSPDLSPLSLNPFRWGDFESIWKAFAREIRGQSGSSSETITFEFGANEGVNKARSFPLSQALLSKGDLIELMVRARVDRLRRGSTTVVWTEVRRERGRLSRRGQRLVSSGFLRDRIVEQVQKFARRTAPGEAQMAPSQQPRLDQVELHIYVDAADFLNEEYRAFVSMKGSSKRTEDAAAIKQKLDAVLLERGYVICTLGELGDVWTLRDGEVTLNSGDNILVVATGFGIQRVRAVLDGLDPPVPLSDQHLIPLGSAATIRVVSLDLPRSLKHRLVVRAGRIVGSGVTSVAPPEYEWIGGVCVDARARKYLRGFLPSAIVFGDRRLDVTELSRVGDTPMTWEGFEKALDTLNSDGSYALRFRNGRGAAIAVGVCREVGLERMGFLFDAAGRLSPTLERIGASDRAVVGYSEPPLAPYNALSIQQLAAVLRDLSERAGRQLTAAERDRIERRVNVSAVSSSVKTTIGRLLSGRGTLRETTLAFLLG